MMQLTTIHAHRIPQQQRGSMVGSVRWCASLLAMVRRKAFRLPCAAFVCSSQ
ncbi:hypothetical protein BAUCODRAFT_85228, partial [Baudoinia panamericana UAMH 10762]